MAPSVECSTVAITKGATGENRHQTTEYGFGRIELPAATMIVSEACEQPITYKPL